MRSSTVLRFVPQSHLTIGQAWNRWTPEQGGHFAIYCRTCRPWIVNLHGHSAEHSVIDNEFTRFQRSADFKRPVLKAPVMMFGFYFIRGATNPLIGIASGNGLPFVLWSSIRTKWESTVFSKLQKETCINRKN